MICYWILFFICPMRTKVWIYGQTGCHTGTAEQGEKWEGWQLKIIFSYWKWKKGIWFVSVAWLCILYPVFVALYRSALVKILKFFIRFSFRPANVFRDYNFSVENTTLKWSEKFLTMAVHCSSNVILLAIEYFIDSKGERQNIKLLST